MRHEPYKIEFIIPQKSYNNRHKSLKLIFGKISRTKPVKVVQAKSIQAVCIFLERLYDTKHQLHFLKSSIDEEDFFITTFLSFTKFQ